MNTIRRRLLALPLLAVLCAPAAAQFRPAATASSGTVPSGVSYQGRLEDSGVPANGIKSMIFRLFNSPSGGTALFDSGAKAVTVKGGVFGVVLDIPLSALVGGNQKYLEITVEGITLQPRDPLLSVPYAKVAESVEGSIEISTGGFTISNQSGPVLHVSSVTAQVGIGTNTFANAGVRLQIYGGDVVIGNPVISNGSSNDDLFVEGNLKVDGQVSFQGSSFSDLGVSTNTNTGELFKVGEGTFTVLQTGRVGLGTNTPGATLDVNSGMVPGVLIRHATQPQLRLQRAGVDQLLIEHDGSHAGINAPNSDLTLETSGVERVRIQSGGNIGIGGTPGAFKLDVQGNANVSGSLSLGTDLAVSEGGTGASNALGAQNNLDVPSRTGAGASGSWGISISGNAATAAALQAGPTTCAVSGQFAKGVDASGNAICADAAAEIPETGIEQKVYDTDNDLTVIGSSWGVASAGTADISLDSADNTLYIDVDQNRVGFGTNSPGFKVDVQGGDVNTSGKVREAGNSLVPAGLVMLFNLAACPSGWGEVTEARGRALVGLPLGGTLRGVPAGVSAYGNQEVRTHTHDLRAHTHDADPDGAGGHVHGPGSHVHAITPVAHNHGLNSHTHDIPAASLVHTHPIGSHTHDFDPPSATSGTPSNTVLVNGGGISVGSNIHTHSVNPGTQTSQAGSGNTGNGNLGPVTTSAAAGNTADTTPAAFNSGSPSAANTDAGNLGTTTSGAPSIDATNAGTHTLPYIQLLVCEKL